MRSTPALSSFGAIPMVLRGCYARRRERRRNLRASFQMDNRRQKPTAGRKGLLRVPERLPPPGL